MNAPLYGERTGNLIKQFARSDTIATYHEPDGTQTIANRHGSMSDFKKASMPITEGTTWRGQASHEYEFNKDGHRAMRMSGREFIGEISTNIISGNIPLGGRLLMFPLVPAALGGRIRLQSELFEQHKVIHITLKYAPVVPTTKEGALAMYFRNDVGTPTLDTGRAEIEHASTHPSFVQTPVWQDIEMEVAPKDAMISYFDESSGDARLEAQGIVTVLAASQLGHNDSLPYGNLYLEYELEFFAAELDYAVKAVEEFTASYRFIGANPTVVGTGANMLLECRAAIGLGSLPQFVQTLIPVADLPNYILYGVLSNTTGDTLFSFSQRASTKSYTFTKGMGFWMRFMESDDTPGLIIASVAADLGSTDILTDSTATAEDGQLYWNLGKVAILDGTVEMRLRTWQINEDTV